ncbi:LysR substrate-binding domain-containing protein [Aromatoleum bremense]|uniref:LysR family transcriptional regulator n=1 Tax=Aromatoleum bremense TaxID=76115 RepID=A0ABX1NVG4_9RHOO|nr:LysR substrate-binding domain-containing protein [Aromatoleum bremense]NMG15912.1 LysR family transcriptional regulator [Aromatoleum bremense]QTQ32466.1 Transcriptional regulator, LysR family [Aromatoleum bremense]
MSSVVRRVPPMHALAAFEAAARLGGFAPAADELCVTPSAVSHRIRQLEAMLGTPLFERTPAGVRPTTVGRLYLESVREAFDKLAQAGAVLQPERERLRVSLPPTFARQLLMARLPEYLRSHPEVEVEMHLSIPLQDVTAETADVEVRWGRGDYPERTVCKLFDDVVMPLAAPSWVAARALRGIADLGRAELLRSPLLPWRPCFAAAGLDWPEPERGAVFNDLGMLFEVAAAGLGAAVGTRRLSAAWVDTGRLVPLFGVTAPAPFTYYAVATPAQHKRAVVRDFIAWLAGIFA